MGNRNSEVTRTTLEPVDFYVCLVRELNMMSDLCSFRNSPQEARSVCSLQSDLPALCYATGTWPDKETASSSMRSISSRIGKMFSEDEPAATMAMPVMKFRPNHKRYVAFDCLFCLTAAV